MKKILLFFGTLFLFLNGFSQSSVFITGETNPNPNQTYTYRINQFIGVSGTNATWKVTNGKFLNGSTTLVQNVDNTSVDVIWTKAGETGTLSYSYQNGSSTGYAGFTSVSIKGDESGGGGETITAPINGPNNAKVGDIVYYKTDIDRFVNYQRTSWGYSPEIFEFIEAKDDYIKLKVKSYGDSYLTVAVYYDVPPTGILKIKGEKYIEIYPGIITPSFLCNNEVFTCSAPVRKGDAINWQSTPSMTLISGQGTTTATYRAKAYSEYGKVTATVTYDGKNYIVEDKIFINGLLFPSYAFIFTNSAGGFNWTSQTMNSFGFRTEDLDSYFDLNVFTHYELYVTDMRGREQFRYTYIYPGQTLPWLSVGWYMCYVRGYSACGVTAWHAQEVEVVADNGGGELFPFSLKSSSENAIAPFSTPSPITVKVYTFNTGTLVYSEKNVTDFNIQNTTLKDGIYIVVSTDQNGETKSEKVVKTRN